MEGALQRGNTFLPDGGFPGPQRIEVADGIHLLALNTSWLLADDPAPTGDTGDFEANADIDVYAELEDVVQRRATSDLIVLGHHPLYSNGRFGGRYPASAHLFPLTLGWDKAFLPLPVIGTVAVAVRRAMGSEQYFSHARNEWMRENLDRILLEHEDFIYVSAHDRSLQGLAIPASKLGPQFVHRVARRPELPDDWQIREAVEFNGEVSSQLVGWPDPDAKDVSRTHNDIVEVNHTEVRRGRRLGSGVGWESREHR